MTARRAVLTAAAVAVVSHACGFDDSLREYLSAQFWLPFAKHAGNFVERGIRRLSAPYAGMTKVQGNSPLEQLRAAYQRIAYPNSGKDPAVLRKLVDEARGQHSLTAKEREEIELIDAKTDMRLGLEDARPKLLAFIGKARTPEYSSEARGWVAHIQYVRGEQTAAGKFYLDELNRKNTNLSSTTLINSLRLTYGYDGGPKLIQHLDDYFDTPEHAAFAIHLVTNPRWNREARLGEAEPEPVVDAPPPYQRIKNLLVKHRKLFRSNEGADMLATLGMRTALRAADPAAALKIAASVPGSARVRSDPNFQWMLAAALFLTRQYEAAEAPLLGMFQSPRSSATQKAAAAYGLCGVYRKTGRTVEQIRMALWLYTQARQRNMYLTAPSMIEDQTVYWAVSGWEIGVLLDAEAPLDSLRSFIEKYGSVPDVRLVRYAIAVRLARADQYEEAAAIYAAIGATRRADRMTRLAALHSDPSVEGRYRMAAFLADNPERIYFNDSLWTGFQRYALFAGQDHRLTRKERQEQIALERKLKDEQEERWHAYLLLRDVIQDSGATETARRAARLALRCLRQINTERFGREEAIRDADIEITNWLKRAAALLWERWPTSQADL